MKQNTHLLAQVEISDGRGASSSSPTPAPRRSSTASRDRPSRSTTNSSRSSPAWKWKSIASRSPAPLILRIRSPGRSPARDAGLLLLTARTTTPGDSAAVVRDDPQGSTALMRIVLSDRSSAGAEAGRRIELLQAMDDVLK